MIILRLAARLDHERLLNKAQLNEMRRFKLAVANVSDQIVISDKDGMVLYANKATETNTGYAIDEVIGLKAGKLWGNQMPREYYKQMWKRLTKDKKVFVGEIKNRRKDGQYYDAKINISPVLDEDGRVSFFVGIERDITKEKEVDRAKSDFISIASHQLRTPLTVVKGYMSMLLENDFGKVPAKQREQLLKVYESNERLISLVADLLNVSRIESGKMSFEFQNLDIEPLVASVVTEITNLAKAKHNYLHYNKPKYKLPKVSADPDKLRQVLSNLIENSVKYTVAGGTEVSLELANDEIRFCVRDTGLGISPADMSKIFEKYSRGDQVTTKAVAGTGLGLYVCKMMIENDEGRIWAESDGEGKGARFYFALPIIK